MAETKKIIYKGYIWKTIKWMAGNTIFGLFPLIFLYAVYIISGKRVCGDGVDQLIYEGTIIFVCIAIVGAVYVEFYLAEIKVVGWGKFATFFFPVIILGYISINYLLIHIKIIDKQRFACSSYTTIATIISCLLYVLLVKTNLYVKEELKQQSKNIAS